MISEQNERPQVFRLGLLTFSHLLADSAGSAIPGFLPVAMTYFGLDLAYGVTIVSVMGIACNLLQIPLSKLGGKSQSPLWIIVGLLLLGVTSWIGYLPQTTPFLLLLLLILLTAFGIALVHPTGLRGVQALKGIPAGMTTPIFMTGGFFGAALSPWIAGMLVERFGLKGLIIFFPLTVLIAFCIGLFRIRLATDNDNTVQKGEVFSPWSLSALLVIATFLNCGSTAFSGLVPYMLNREVGFTLGFGNMALFLFGGGSSAVSVLLGVLASKRRVDSLLLILLFAGLPFTLLFFLLAGAKWAIVLALFSGTLCSSVFPILVAMAKTSRGRLSLGLTMGLMVGGTWGISGLVFLLVGITAKYFNAKDVLTIVVPAFYLFAALTALFTRKREKKIS